MDAVTHVLVGFLIGHGVYFTGPLVAWTTFMAFFPDVDTVSWVLKERVPWLKHRGLTHSFLVGVSVSAIGATGLAYGWGIPWSVAFLAGLIGFTSHVLLDVLNWGCELAWPWSGRRFAFTVQAGLREPFYGSLTGFVIVAVGAARGALTLAVFAVSAAWVAYLLGKLVLKVAILMRHGPGTIVYPTAHPLRWHVIPAPEAGGLRAKGHTHIAAHPRPPAAMGNVVRKGPRPHDARQKDS